MTALDEIRAAQHDDLTLTSDHALWAYLTSRDTRTVRRDLLAHASREERRMVHRTRPSAA